MSAAVLQGASGVAAPVEAGARTVPRRSVRSLLLGAVAVLAVAGGATYGHRWWTLDRFIVSTDDAYVGGDIAALAPDVAGVVTAVTVVDNQPVRAGDVLLRIDDRPYRAALARADASVAAQQAALENLAATRHLQEAMLQGARADLQAAQAELVRSRLDVARYKTLSSDQYASQQRYQQADADDRKAAASSAKAQAAVDAAERQLAVTDTQKQQAEAALAVADADREIARLNLGYTEIRAPFDGVVGNRSTHTGAYATVGAALMSLVPTRGLWVDANFKESQLARIRAGEAATVEADVLPGQVFTGRVASLAPATGAQFSVLPPENATGNFTKIVQRVPVRILLDDTSAALAQLRPGLSVTAAVDERTGAPTQRP